MLEKKQVFFLQKSRRSANFLGERRSMPERRKTGFMPPDSWGVGVAALRVAGAFYSDRYFQ
jgi:hypothetical protein